MTTCTLCVDRIYDEHLPKEDRKPACVKACPTGALFHKDDSTSEKHPHPARALQRRRVQDLPPRPDR